jgi:hypothetical protein
VQSDLASPTKVRGSADKESFRAIALSWMAATSAAMTAVLAVGARNDELKPGRAWCDLRRANAKKTNEGPTIPRSPCIIC